MRHRASNSGGMETNTGRGNRAAQGSIGEPTIGRQSGTSFRETRYGWVVLGLVWTAGAAYMAAYLRHGWVPVDAGSLGEMAERILHGQVPFRDFGEIYTGGLAYLNALAFWLFGVNLLSIRIPLFLFFLGWVPSVYFLARRFVGPAGATIVTLLSVAWSVPNYPEAMPSWYNLFFATWGALALFRYTENERKRWLWVAGFCGGLSFLAKVSGLFFVAAGLLFLVYREILVARRSPREDAPLGNSVAYRLFASGGVTAFLAVVAILISQRSSLVNFICFIAPIAALVGFLLWEVWREGSDGSGARIRRLLSMGLPFLGGIAAPIAAFLLWLASRGALRQMFEGAFVLSMRRMQWAVMSPKLAELAPGLLPIALVWIASFAPKRFRWIASGAAVAALAAVLVECGRSYPAFESVGKAPLLLVPLGAVGATLWLAISKGVNARVREQTFLLIGVAAVASLIEFPYTAPIYFCYIAPLLALALAALLAQWKGFGRFSIGMLALFYLAFGMGLHTPGYFATLRLPPPPEKPVTMRTLRLKRAGGIRVAATEASEYETLIAAVRAHAGGPYIYAANDCPDVYFLSGKQNPTGTIWDFLDPDFFSAGRSARILRTIAAHHVDTVVLHNDPYFSGPVPATLRKTLDARYPHSERVGDFDVRWK